MALRIIREAETWNLHSHSKFSAQDALPAVGDMVSTIVGYNQKALGLTDHGNMAGTVELYRAAKKAGIKPFPGTELYVVQDRADGKAKRHHMCVVAYTSKGYENLVNLNSLASQNFHYKPLVGFGDFANLAADNRLEGLAATSGCYFGYIAQAMARGDVAESKRIMMLMAKWFPKFYVELQNHNIVHDPEVGTTDDNLADSLMHLSQELGIPNILTQDSHYLTLTDKPHHETMKRLVSWGDDPDDAVFPGDGFQLADDSWFKSHHDEARYERGVEGLKDLYDSHDLSIKQLDNYSYNIPFTVPDPQSELTTRATTTLIQKHLPDRYMERLLDELEIVRDTGMAGYLLLVAAVTDWCRENHVFYQARGSASGSIICWLTQITQFDPIKYDLRFERFISRDRMKPPDVDLDIEHTRREDLIQWLSQSYSVMQIGTWAKMGLHDEDEGGAGTLVRKFYTMWNKTQDEKVHTWDRMPTEWRESLYALSDYNAYNNYGKNAAGLIVTTSRDELTAIVPTMRSGTKKDPTWISQYPKDDVEALGLVKLDILGLQTLSVLNICMKNLGRNVEEGLDWIPLNDRQTYNMISRGQTEGVFQLEGYTARRGVRELKPSKIDDIIASMALFRPATLSSGATKSFIKRKHKEERVPQRHELIHRNTVKTFGIIVYQEQVISILRELGMSPDDLTSFLKAVKASNAAIGDAAKVIEGHKASVKAMAHAVGIRGDDWSLLWEAIEGFSAYGFNKAHATAYGFTAYRCAYLSCHYPTQFFAAQLSVWAGTDKEVAYLKAARERGIKLRRAEINESNKSYTVVREGTIRKGLLSIDGIAEISANKIIAARPPEGFTSIDDFCQRLGTSLSGIKNYKLTGETDSGTLGKLFVSGVMSNLEEL
jgi:DNA polymerase-3 subunit alpha